MVESFLNACPCCRLANILKSDSVTGTCQGISWVYYLLAPRHSTKLQRKKYLEGVWTSYGRLMYVQFTPCVQDGIRNNDT